MLSAHFWKKNLACIKLGIKSKTAYPIDFLMGIAIMPVTSFLSISFFWAGLIYSSDSQELAGFSTPYYISYFLWLMLQLGSINWSFERKMIAEINTGAVNALLLRPSSFFEYHLGQLLGQKLMVSAVMTPIIICIAWAFGLPFHIERLPAALMMGFSYVILIFSLHFAIASMAFFFDHVYSLNTTKNMIIWFLTGELMPLDLMPSPYKEWVIALPFSSGMYLPASYLSGRIGTEVFLQGFISLGISGIILGVIARLVWKAALRRYGGTGA